MAYLALDLGAGSGRAIVGTIENGRIRTEELHRFDNTPVRQGGHVYWNILSLFDNIKKGIGIAAKKGYTLRGIAVDTWGVDFGLTDAAGNMLANPITYRDSRTFGISDKVLDHITKEYLYERTGIQQMEINTLFQLYSLKRSGEPYFSIADKLLFIPDLINYFLTGKQYNEYTIASTSQLVNAQTKQWEYTIFEKLGIPVRLAGTIIKPGTIIGDLLPEIAEETGVKNVPVFAVGSHDTASATAAIPGDERHRAFLSSGTWSLLGIETDEPILTKEASENDFTNEGGVNDKILFMRNCTGLWLLQRFMEEYEKENGEKISYDHLLKKCTETTEFRSIVNSDDPAFSNPVSMTNAIREYCARTDQPIPQTPGEIVRCILESLALKYRFVMNKLKECSGREINELHIVGGGSQNELLNQFTADSLNVTVVTGLTESTALGNIIRQAVSDNRIRDIEEGRQIIRNSFSFKLYDPKDPEKWKEVAERTKRLFI